MNNELVKALRWCQTHGCSKCVALLDNGSCKYGGAIKIFDAAADALEAADKRKALAAAWERKEQKNRKNAKRRRDYGSGNYEQKVFRMEDLDNIIEVQEE